MLHRTALVNFADLADEDDYSLSDDVKPDEFDFTNKNSFVSPKTLYHCSLEQQLSSIDATISNSSEKVHFFSQDENDYKIDQIIKSLQLRQNVTIDVTKCAIIDIAHPAQYKLSTSEYLNASPYFLTWTPINSASSTEFPSIVQNNIKTYYQSINKDLKFVHFVAPAAERMGNLCQIRKEIPIGRVIFHYIGFGLPTNQNGCISVCEGRLLKPYSVGRIFKDIRTPSWFIFDCDNAGSFLPVIMQQCQKLQARIDKNSPINWCDWYCLCATSENEVLPKDPKLPRDFLTSCLLTPVKLSILCHILKYFRISLENPFQYLSQLEKSPDLQEMLTVITDAIASDYVKPKFFFQMFRHDKLVGTIFRRFILAQYLLKGYEIHPISNPSLPDMTKHQMWQEWEASIDIWVASNLTVPPSFCSNYFQRVSNFFTSALNSNSPINQSILLTMCHIVQFQPEYFTSIADFAVKNPENIAQLATSILFDQFFQIFVENGIDPEPYESLCYIIIAMLQYDYNFINEIKKELNYVPLVRLIFDQSVSQVTRTFISAILGFLSPVTRNIQDSCMTKLFMSQIKSEIPKATSLYLPWLLLLLKRIYGVSTASLSSFYNMSVHIQVASCIFHNSFACRASTVSALSCFMQNDENPILNFVLLMMTSPALFDVSYLVRYQLLLFVIRFLTTNQNELSNLMKDCNLNISFNSFSSIFEHWIQLDNNNNNNSCRSFYQIYGDFTLFAKAIDSASKKENLLKEACSFSLFVIKYFCHDPHPTIKNISLMAKQSFDNLLSNNTSNNGDKPKCHSISPPFGWNISDTKRQPFPFNFEMKQDKNLQPTQIPVPLTPNRSVASTNKPKMNSPPPSPTSVKLQTNLQLSTQLSTSIISMHLTPNTNNYYPLFENDSDALFTILMHQLVSSGKNILHKKFTKSTNTTKVNDVEFNKSLERHSSSGVSTVGGINIPTVHLRLRCEIHSPIKNPVKIAFERESTKSVIASKSKWLYHIDSSMNVTSKIRISEFPISDLKLLDIDTTSKVSVAACFDGTVKLWKCGTRDCYSSFRADCTFTDTKNPLLFDIHAFSKKIVTGRNGIQFFDLKNQKLISDWLTPSRVTALCLHPSNENMCVVGMLNGSVNAFDLRMKEKISIDFGKIISVGVNEPIVKIMPNRNGADFVYCATSTGKLIEWNATTNTMKIINGQINSQLLDFEVHKSLPLIAMTAVDDSPMICSPKGKVLYKAKNIPPGSIFAFHPVLPIISFGTPNSDLLHYDINLLSNDQKP